MQYKHCDFLPMDYIEDYYKRTGMIVITHWAYTKSEFEKNRHKDRKGNRRY